MTPEHKSSSRRTLLVGLAASLAFSWSAVAQTGAPSDRKGASMRLRCAFADQEFSATLEDNPSARDLLSMAPLDLSIDDYATIEKITYLPRKLTEEGSGTFGSEQPGDLCDYALPGVISLSSMPVTAGREA